MAAMLRSNSGAWEGDEAGAPGASNPFDEVSLRLSSGDAAAAAAAAAHGGAFGGGFGGAGASEAELAAAVAQIAEMAQLGVGAAAAQFPRTLEEYYMSCQDELPFRVAL